MITRGLHEFVSRDWAGARDAKDAYWGHRIAELGPAEALRIAEELRRQVMQLDPAWPDEALRREDFESHLRLSDRFRRAGPACRG